MPIPTRLAWVALIAAASISSGVMAQEAVLEDVVPATLYLNLVEEAQARVAFPGGPVRRGRPVAVAVAVEPEPLPADAAALVGAFDNEAAAMRKKVEQEIQTRRQTLINALQALQDGYTRNAKLDEAVAIRNVIRQLKVCHLNPQPNPGNLISFQDRIGEIFHFDVVGYPNAMIWGSEVYTCDSDLATAAVHAGVLKPGQRGIVKVTIIKSPGAHRGSNQNGVPSYDWGPYSASYIVEPANPNTAMPNAAPAGAPSTGPTIKLSPVPDPAASGK